MINKAYIYKHLVPDFVKRYRRKKRVQQFIIIKHPEKKFKVLARLKDASWDDMKYPPLYGHTKDLCMSIYSPAIYAYLINWAIVNSGSDVVLSEEGAYWDKYNEEEFLTWAKPGDCNVYNYNNNIVNIVMSRNKEYVYGAVISLLGVNCYHWVHFLAQFACKLYFAGEKGLLDNEQNITILYHDHGDKCIRQFIDDFLINYPHVKVKKAEQKIDYICEKLIAIPSTSPNFNEYNFRLDYPYVITKDVIDRVDKYVVKPYIDKVKDKPTRYEKVFIPREGMRHTLTNYKEIHDFFVSQGFVDVDGGKLSLEEKADIFYHAKEVICIDGGGTMNMMFCNGAKCMVMLNYYLVTQTWCYAFSRDKVKRINVAGQDQDSSSNSNFYIPLEKVMKVYRDYVQTN